jgi:hypothetical protein
MMKVSEMQKFFEKHIQLYEASNLSKAKYCKLNKLSYSQFNYWFKKKLKRPDVLVPVKIKPAIPALLPSTEPSSKILCTLNFNEKLCLKIYDAQAMQFIWEALKCL